MKTSAENRKIRALLSALQSGELTPKPGFQRKLVWSNKDKLAFLDTVLTGYPFPEIYIAAGEVDLVTAKGTELLVDGQQRITTLHQYFVNSDAIELSADIPPYNELNDAQKTEFLNYDVAVRNLGIVDLETVKEVFKRINSTSYSLNAMEIQNARYRGPLKKCADDIAADKFFKNHKLFSVREIRRMDDVVYSLTLIICMLSNYFNRKVELEPFLKQYNDEFADDLIVRERFEKIKTFIDDCGFSKRSRAWKKTDFLVLFIELDRIINKEQVNLDAAKIGKAVETFYERVNQELGNPSGDDDLQTYFKTTVQATNDRSSRINRGRVIRKVILAA